MVGNEEDLDRLIEDRGKVMTIQEINKVEGNDQNSEIDSDSEEQQSSDVNTENDVSEKGDEEEKLKRKTEIEGKLEDCN